MSKKRSSRLPAKAGSQLRVFTDEFKRDAVQMLLDGHTAVPSNTLVRDLEIEPPAYEGRGAPPKTPFGRVDKWRAALPETGWTKIDVRDGHKGPLLVEMVACRVQAKTDKQRVGPDEVLVVIRTRDEHGVFKHDYYLSNAAADTPLTEFARVANAEHRIEECLQRGKSEAGLADYEVRSWPGWHHHQTLSLVAAWFLIGETRRGKKINARYDLSTDPTCHRLTTACGQSVRRASQPSPRTHAAIRTNSTRPFLSPQNAQPLGSLGFRTTTDLEQ